MAEDADDEREPCVVVTCSVSADDDRILGEIGGLLLDIWVAAGWPVEMVFDDKGDLEVTFFEGESAR